MYLMKFYKMKWPELLQWGHINDYLSDIFLGDLIEGDISRKYERIETLTFLALNLFVQIESLSFKLNCISW